jgi:hypothetical protein
MARLKQVSSLSQEKEAKRLSFVFVGFIRRDTCRKWIKVFWFFFQKRTCFLGFGKTGLLRRARSDGVAGWLYQASRRLTHAGDSPTRRRYDSSW